MPVIHSKAKRENETDERAVLVRRLANEWSGKSSKDGPVIFEIPKARGGKMDVMIIWNEWSSIPFQDRWDIIDEAFQVLQEQNRAHAKRKPKSIMMAFGATVAEAIRNGLLPYSVRETDVNESFDNETLKKIRDAKIKRGAIPLSSGDFALSFPTQTMARDALNQLRKELPNIEWVSHQEKE